MSVAGEVEQRDALVLVGFVGVLVSLNFALAAVLLLAPLVRHSLGEGGLDQPIELVDIHCINAILQPLELGLVAPDGLLVLAAFVGVACMQRIAHPFQNLVVELQPPQQLGELRFERLLADVFAPARGRVALALTSIAGAMIVDVARLLDLPDYRAAAGMAGDQPGKGESTAYAIGRGPHRARSASRRSCETTATG